MTKRDQIAALVGEEAADLAYRAVHWYRIGALLAFPVGSGCILVAILLRQPYLLLAITPCLVWVGACLVPGARLDGRAGQAASAYLSQQEGVPIVVKSGGIRLWVWQREIARAHQRIEAEDRQRQKQAASDLGNQQWLEQKQKKWEEYRRQHPQEPGQGG